MFAKFALNAKRASKNLILMHASPCRLLHCKNEKPCKFLSRLDLHALSLVDPKEGNENDGI